MSSDSASGSGIATANTANDIELAALLALLSVEDLGPNRLRALLADHGDSTASDYASHQASATTQTHLTQTHAAQTRTATQALAALRHPKPSQLVALLNCKGVNVDRLHTWATALRKVSGDDLLQSHRQAGIHLETPAQLAQIPLWQNDPEPPTMLFRKGTPVNYESRRVAIVGTRRCSGYGRAVAQRLGTGLAHAGVTVVSGLASGIDGEAQRAAHQAGGAVIGVVASGLDVIYPPSNSQLWHDIATSGTLLSEYPMGTSPRKWHFPARNRLIAALAEVVIVVESGPTGGSFYTVDEAAERGVPVMAVPGPITARSSEGPNALLADGCAVVRGVEDVLLALDLTPGALPFSFQPEPFSSQSNSSKPNSSKSSPSDSSSSTPCASEISPNDPESNDLGPKETKLLDQLIAGPATIDELITSTNTNTNTSGSTSTSSSLAQTALMLDRLRQNGWVIESGGWWERVR